jgi:DNA-binding response OmpR family regulator
MTETNFSVLVVDDEPLQVRPLCQGLRAIGGEVVEMTSLDSARDVIKERQFDLFVLDRELRTPLGVDDGLDLCREIRDSGHPARIVIYTNLASATEHREGWAAGADDYIEKTWAAEIAIARCQAHLSRTMRESPTGDIKRYAIDGLPDNRHLVVDERAIVVARAEDFDLVRKGGLVKLHLDYEDRERLRKTKMTDLDLAVFFHLYRNQDEWVSEYDLLREVWAYSELRLKEMASNPDANSGLVHTTIARIRRKIDTRMSDAHDLKKDFHDRGNWAYIATSSHAGQEVVSYKFIGGDSDIHVESASPVLT